MCCFVCFYRFVFAPLWLFHAVIARGRFSLPAPSMPHDRHVWHFYDSLVSFWTFDSLLCLSPNLVLWQWAPFHSVMATPLLVAFEILLCVHLEDKYGIFHDFYSLNHGMYDWWVYYRLWLCSSVCSCWLKDCLSTVACIWGSNFDR